MQCIVYCNVDRIKHLLRTGADQTQFDVIVVGSGMAGLSAAALLTSRGKRVLVLEANYLPGGCSSSYYRQGYWFESGATTLVGLGDSMPLQYVLDETGIKFEAWPLALPMQVHLGNKTINRYPNINLWIDEAERQFGVPQRKFWKHCHAISEFVWQSALQQLYFPPEKLSDVANLLGTIGTKQLAQAPAAFRSTESLLKQYNLNHHTDFRRFVDEQLIITAQNHMPQVNQLFGATALCYTNYPNYYVPGGLINMAGAFVKYLVSHQSDYRSRQPVRSITRSADGYRVFTEKDTFDARQVIAAIPLNNMQQIADFELNKRTTNHVLGADKLWSAYQLSLVFKRRRDYASIHHQIHLNEPLEGLGAHSLFLSMSHPDDTTRAPEGLIVASVSAHLPAGSQYAPNEELLNRQVIDLLQRKGFLKREDVVYMHSSTQTDWEKWTRRQYGFVGGYPQYADTKPWQMNGHRLNDAGAYICGDSTYPGQGIPGATLSGIIAANKLLSDWG